MEWPTEMDALLAGWRCLTHERPKVG